MTLKAQACVHLATIHTTLAPLKEQAQNITVGQVKAAQEKIATAAQQLVAQIPSDDAPTLDNLKTANTNLTNALNGHPDTATVGEIAAAQPGYEDAVTKAQTAQANLSTKLECTP
jgi:hypothetical protein